MDRLRRGRRPQIPGALGDVFGAPGRIPGGSGQFIDYDLPLTYIADPRDLANSDGLGGIYGVPDFLWVAGDGNTPTIGPALTQFGTPVTGQSMWEYPTGAPATMERYDGVSCRKYSAAPIGPSVTEDAVFAIIGKCPRYGGLNTMYFSTITGAGIGYQLYKPTVSGQLVMIGRTTGGTRALITAGGTFPSMSFFILLCIHDRALGQIELWWPGGSVSNTLAAGNSDGSGIGIASLADGNQRLGSDGELLSVMAFFGVGIATTWAAGSYALAKEFSCTFSGLCPSIGGASAFARASLRAHEDRNGIWHIANTGVPCAGDSIGFKAASVRTNKCYNTIDPQATTGWSTTGGTHTVPSDASQLETDGLRNFGPNVHRFVPGGSDQVIYGGATTANTNKHSSSLFLRGAAGGESVDVGVRDSSSGVVTNHQTVVCTTSWQRVQIDGWTPGDTDEQFALDCDTGDTILFIAPQMEEGQVGTSPIPNFATAASATRAQDVLTIPNTPSDSEGSIALFVTPDNWSAADLTGLSPDILSRATVASTILYTSTAGYNSNDGTTTITTGTPTDGVENAVRCRWVGTQQGLAVDAVKVSGAYDGSQSGTGTWAIKPTDVEFRIRNLTIYRNGDGL